jgi:hypothetical protein
MEQYSLIIVKLLPNNVHLLAKLWMACDIHFPIFLRSLSYDSKCSVTCQNRPNVMRSTIIMIITIITIITIIPICDN